MLLQALCIISYPLVNSNLSYSPETLNSGQKRRFFEPWVLEILQMNLNKSYNPKTLNSIQNCQLFCPVSPYNLTDDLQKQ